MQRSASQTAAKALLRCAVCPEVGTRWEGLWRWQGAQSDMEDWRGAQRLGQDCPATQCAVSERSYIFHPHQSPFVLSGVRFRKSSCHGPGRSNSYQVRSSDSSCLRALLGIFEKHATTLGGSAQTLQLPASFGGLYGEVSLHSYRGLVLRECVRVSLKQRVRAVKR